MKINKILFGASLLVLASSCSKDNYDIPQAAISGTLVDATSKTAVPGVVGNGNFGDLQFFQLDYGINNPSGFTTAGFNADGHYSNLTMFNGKYKLVPRGPYFYQDTVIVDVKGNLSVDLPVVPFVDVQLTVSAFTSTSITVQVNAKRNPNADVIMPQKIASVVAILGTTNGVNYNNYHIVNNNTSAYRYVKNTKDVTNEQIASENYTHTFNDLQPGTTYFLRGASLVSTNNPSNYYNYSKLLEVKTSD